jgi:peptidoglycan-associated lipoprotein
MGDKECGESQFCDSGSCAERPECGDNSLTPACPEGKECVSGACQIKITECSADPVYFDYNQSSIKRSQREKLQTVATCLQGDNVANLVVEGHCDERGTEEYNMALGERRASAAKRYLEKKGAPADKVSTMSYGKNRPAVDGSNEGAWRKNRRSEFNSSK